MSTNPTVDAYNKYAEIYDQEVIEFWEKFPKEFVDKFVSELTGKRILNLGSGSGRDALLLRAAGLDVVCLDASRPMIDMTTKLGFESHLATFAELNFPDNSFDGVWAYTSLVHITPNEAKKVIQQIHKLLKPRGLFVIGAIKGQSARMVERQTMPDSTRYFKFYSNRELVKMIQPLGFSLLYSQDYQPHNSVYLNQIYRRLDSVVTNQN